MQPLPLTRTTASAPVPHGVAREKTTSSQSVVVDDLDNVVVPALERINNA